MRPERISPALVSSCPQLWMFLGKGCLGDATFNGCPNSPEPEKCRIDASVHTLRPVFPEPGGHLRSAVATLWRDQ